MSTFVICEFRYAEYKNSFFFPLGTVLPAAFVSQLMVRVLERGPEIPLLAAAARPSGWLLAGTATSPPSDTRHAAIPAEFGGSRPLECPWLDTAVPTSPGSPAALSSPPGTEINEERLWQAGLHPPSTPGSTGEELLAKQGSSFAGCFADCQSGPGLGRFFTFLESTSKSSNRR